MPFRRMGHRIGRGRTALMKVSDRSHICFVGGAFRGHSCRTAAVIVRTAGTSGTLYGW